MTMGTLQKQDIDSTEIITSLAKRLKKSNNYQHVLPITTAKVPIVKFYIRSFQCEADISLYNVLALENTRMLAAYCQVDERVAILGYTVKIFAKV